jgi:hypothetical protein
MADNMAENQEMQDDICELILAGYSQRAAARLVGCAPNTIRNTATRDAAFRRQLKQAHKQYQLRQLELMSLADPNRRLRGAADMVRTWRQTPGERTPQDRASTRQLADVMLKIILASIGQDHDV